MPNQILGTIDLSLLRVPSMAMTVTTISNQSTLRPRYQPHGIFTRHRRTMQVGCGTGVSTVLRALPFAWPLQWISPNSEESQWWEAEKLLAGDGRLPQAPQPNDATLLFSSNGSIAASLVLSPLRALRNGPGAVTTRLPRLAGWAPLV